MGQAITVEGYIKSVLKPKAIQMDSGSYGGWRFEDNVDHFVFVDYLSDLDKTREGSDGRLVKLNKDLSCVKKENMPDIIALGPYTSINSNNAQLKIYLQNMYAQIYTKLRALADDCLAKKTGGDGGLSVQLVVYVLVVLIVYLFCNMALRLSETVSGLLAAAVLFMAGQMKLIPTF